MENIILVLNIILAILLVAIILLQKSEGGALGLGVSQDSFISSRSAGSFLTKATAIIATLFIITSISLTIMSKEEFAGSSVLEKIEENKLIFLSLTDPPYKTFGDFFTFKFFLKSFLINLIVFFNSFILGILFVPIDQTGS